MTEDQIEKYAMRIALGNNGGGWATHYKEDQKEFWRNMVRELVQDITQTTGKKDD